MYNKVTILLDVMWCHLYTAIMTWCFTIYHDNQDVMITDANLFIIIIVGQHHEIIVTREGM